MTDAIQLEQSGMKNENLILNGICLLLAIGFLAFAVLNIFMAGDFLTTDSLFVTAFSLVLVLLFISLPLMGLRARHMERKAAASGETTGALHAAPAGMRLAEPATTVGALRALSPRPAVKRLYPPDVEKMLAVMGTQKAESE